VGENGRRGPVFDPHSPDLSPERAYRLYAQLRSGCPVSRGEQYGGYWAVSRAVSDHRFPPIDYDPPERSAFRRLIAPLTSGAAAKAMEPRIRATVNRLVDGFVDRGSAELVEELAIPLPLDVITQLYGLEARQGATSACAGCP
jgi:hypothetical protein